MSRPDDAPAWLVRLFIAGGWVLTLAPAAALLTLLVVLT